MHIDVSLYTRYSEHEWNQSWFFLIDQDSGWSVDQWTNTLDEFKVHLARMGVWSERHLRGDKYSWLPWMKIPLNTYLVEIEWHLG